MAAGLRVKLSLEGLEALGSNFRELAENSSRNDNVTVLVGYTAGYAAAVHEKVAMKMAGEPRRSGLGNYWDGYNGRGNPKFLEGPARDLAPELGRIVANSMDGPGKSLGAGLMLAGLRLQRESMGQVPVEYGALAASAFTEIEQ